MLSTLRSNQYFISIVFIILLFSSCNKDNPITEDPDIPEILNTISLNIDNQGGKIELEGFSISIPVGAFDENNEITLNILGDYESGFENKVSEIYQIEGLPEKTNKEIAIRMPHSGSLSESSFLALGQEAWNKSMDSLSMGYGLVEAIDSSGFLIATLPEIDDGANFSGEDIHTRIGQKWSLNILAISGYINVVSEEGHFKVVTQSANIDAALDLTSYFETAYSKFKDLGFSYSKRTKWPVTVTVKNLQGEFGAQMNSFFGINYGYIEIDKSILSNKDIMQVTAGHEFFHIVQSFYDPRGTFSMARSQSPNLWLEEASSTWSEELFSSTPNYIPTNFIQNYNLVPKGALNGDGDNASSYGYGMSAFIKYVVDRYNTDLMVKIFEELRSGKTPISALNNTLSLTVSRLWDNFIEDFFTFKIYKGDYFKPASVFISLASEGHNKFDIKTETDTTQIFDEKLNDLSCEVYSLNFTYKDFSPNGLIEFVQECDTYDYLMFFKYKNTTSCELIARGKDTLVVNDFIDIINDGYKIGAVACHGKLDVPYTAKVELEAAFRIKEIFDFDYMRISIHLDGELEHDIVDDFWGDTLYTDYGEVLFSTINAIENYPFTNTVNGNTITSTANFTDQYGQQISYNIISKFNRINGPTKLEYFEFESNLFHSENGATTTRYKKIILEDLPFREDYFPDYYGVLQDEFSQNVVEATYTQNIVFAGSSNSRNLTLFSYNSSDKGMSIWYEKKDE